MNKTKEEKLKEIIEKGRKNGCELVNEWPHFQVIIAGVGFYEDDVTDYVMAKRGVIYSIEEILFSHDFAKAFWGTQEHDWGYDNPTCSHCKMLGTGDVWEGNNCWSSHLQQCVISSDPIEYYYKFI